MYINYIVNVLCVANSYKYMYENCAGGLDALVIVQHMHVTYYNRRCTIVFTVNGLHLIGAYIRRREAVGNCRGDDRKINQ